MMPEKLTQLLKSEAGRLGFDLCGACPAVSPPGASHLAAWVAAGYAGEMHYIANRQAAYSHPGHVMEGVVSLLVLGLNYLTQPARRPGRGQGKVARYAWGDADYHDLIQEKLKHMCRFAEDLDPEIVVRGVVDTAPLLEREFAQLAGIGWRAKNTMLINRDFGSWFFLAALLINKPLKYDSPFELDHCGTCTACLTACPTSAFPQPRMLDATKCISYLTIEHRTAIPNELRPQMGDWLFGCDICQDVCPWNNKTPASANLAFGPMEDRNPVDLISLFELDDQQFRARYRKTPLWRPRRRGILRNAAIVLGNNPCPEAISALAKGIDDLESLVRGASAWALGQQQDQRAQRLLEQRLVVETDPEVVQEIEAAMLEFARKN
jgi:epoxyqueuosine reductase